MYSRDLVIKTHAVTDYTNKAIAYISSSIDIGKPYFNSVVPPSSNGNVRMKMNITVDYF